MAISYIVYAAQRIGTGSDVPLLTLWSHYIYCWYLVGDFHRTMYTLFSTMSLYLLWPCIRYNKKKERIQGHTLGVIMDLGFENHKNVKKCIFCTLEQAGTNICSMGYQNSNFEIGLSLFRCAGKYTEQRAHCAMLSSILPSQEKNMAGQKFFMQ